MALNHDHNLIFVSIAAYRDPQLLPTIEDCLVKALRPQQLRFGICWQHAPEDADLPHRDDPRFRILSIDWRQSRGACWARSEVMKLWRGEEWFLQVDSHCRFAQHWDRMLIDEAKLTESAKPVLSTYASPFTPGGEETLTEGPLQMAFQGFTQDGIPHMKPAAIPGWEDLTRPRRARFLSAGFLFTPGAFVQEIGYDPELYFLGEEAAMTVRAFTSGYDLFHPHRTVVWHDYGRPDASKHWDDHTQANEVDRQWQELDAYSKAKIGRLLTGQPMESYGLGSTRTLAEYEQYAGLSLALRKAQAYTIRSEEPPNPQIEPDWAGQIFSWMVRITLERSTLPVGALEDPFFWYVAVQDQNHTEIYRQDIPASQLNALPAEEPKIVLYCEFESATIPAAWSVWPVSRSAGWLRRSEGWLSEEDFTMLKDEPAGQEHV
jgi:hypothetical protein